MNAAVRPRLVVPVLSLVLAALVVLLAPEARAQGVLVPTNRDLGPVALKHQRVQVEVKNGTAVTRIQQVFHNSTGRDLEATFLFPMPEEAAILDFAMWMNGRKVHGEVLDRTKARRIYERIVRWMRDPGLIEWAGHSLFQARIYPVPARGDQKIEIAYTQVLPYEDGVYRYRYPMRTPHGAMRTLEDFTMHVELTSATPIRNVYSPTHEVYVRKKDEQHATAGFEKDAALLDKDFELLYTVSREDIGLNLLTYRPEGKPGYFLMMAAPKATWAEREIVGKNVVFVVDTSGSMKEHGKMARARAALRYCIERLNPKDRFNIIRFSSDVERFRDGFVGADKARREALDFVDGLEAAGGTAIHAALLDALALDDAERPIVVFVTDGRPTIGKTSTKVIAKAVAKANRAGARLFTFGVGHSVNTKLLDRLAAEHGGVATYVKPGAEMEEKITAFYNKMSHPVMGALSLEIRKVRPYAMLPGRLPDLFKGDQLLVLGRYRESGDALVRLSGEIAGEARQVDFEGHFPKQRSENAFIAQLWAQRQVGTLLEQIRLHGESTDRVAEVKQLALEYGIVTPYTSYLATETGGHRQTRREVRGGSRWRDTTTSRDRGGEGRAPDRDGLFDSPYPSGGAGLPASEPAPAAPRTKKSRRVLARTGALEEDSGADAVETSKVIRELKETETVAPAERGLRYVRGRVFRWDGGWVDSAFRTGLPTLRVKYLSEGYLRLVREVPALKPFLSLGEHVTVVRREVAIIVGPTGPERVSDKDLARVR